MPEKEIYLSKEDLACILYEYLAGKPIPGIKAMSTEIGVEMHRVFDHPMGRLIVETECPYFEHTILIDLDAFLTGIASYIMKPVCEGTIGKALPRKYPDLHNDGNIKVGKQMEFCDTLDIDDLDTEDARKIMENTVRLIGRHGFGRVVF